MAEDTFAERLWEGIDEAFEPYDVSSHLVELFKEDLKDAFTVKGKARPGYEPGAAAFVGINLIDAVTNPLKTLGKTVGLFRGELNRPPIPLAWTDAEGTVWRRVFATSGVDLAGRPLVPRSLEDAILRWNEGARVRELRLIREERGIRQTPGLTLMMAQRLNYYYTSLPGARAPLVGGVMLPNIIQEATHFESEIARHLAAGDWAGAGGVQTAWFHKSNSYRDVLRKEFERVSRLGQTGASYAAWELANSFEAQFWRYWQNRNLYFLILNGLNTYREKGFWGLVKEYIWKEAVKRIFGLKPEAGAPAWAVLRYYSYPKNLISGAVGWTAERVRLTAALTKLTDWRQRLKNWWKRKVKDRLTKALDWIREEIIRKFGRWIIKKLGLKVILAKIGALIGGAIGTVAPVIGNAIGAVLGAVVSFIGGIVAEYIGKDVLKGTLYLFGAGCGCLALAVGGMVFLLVGGAASVFGPGVGGPGPGPGPPPLPPVAQVTIKKESCIKGMPIGGVETWNCRTRSQIGNNTGVQEIKWQITIENGSDQTAQVVISDTECGQTWRYTSDGEGFLNPGDKKFPYCIKEYNAGPGGENVLNTTTVYNTVMGTAWVGSDSRELYAVGMLVIGAPPDAPPCGYPAGTAMTITSSFMAADACRPYDLLCGTVPMEGCGDNNATGLHSGLDLVVAGTEVQNGQELYSTINGTVMHIHSGSGSDWAYITVCNSHWCILYGHTYRTFPVSVGDTVTVGQHIAWLDDTGYSFGPHVHYMVWDDPAIFTWANFSDCAPNCCSSPLHNPANFLGACD